MTTNKELEQQVKQVQEEIGICKIMVEPFSYARWSQLEKRIDHIETKLDIDPIKEGIPTQHDIVHNELLDKLKPNKYDEDIVRLFNIIDGVKTDDRVLNSVLKLIAIILHKHLGHKEAAKK